MKVVNDSTVFGARASTYVDCPQRGSVFTLEDGVLIEYPKAADGAILTEDGGAVVWEHLPIAALLGLHRIESLLVTSSTLLLLKEVGARVEDVFSTLGRDGDCLDRIAAFLNLPGQWNGGDVCEFVATELQRCGREILEEDR